MPITSVAHPRHARLDVVMDFPNPANPALMYVASMAGDLSPHTGSRRPPRYTSTFEHLRANALDPTGSIKLIQEHSAAISVRNEIEILNAVCQAARAVRGCRRGACDRG
ncbi:hypothetical protein ACGFIY_33425 [Micromonospora chersina]|uniref:hypothetical protein n=1 Tax=Micromonospora chersina TaxID=47854 RepID=UPI003723D597